jgi:hypothetical protein
MFSRKQSMIYMVVTSLSIAIVFGFAFVSINNSQFVSAQQSNTTNSSSPSSTGGSSSSGLVATNNTIIGNTIIPSTTNGTTTTSENATGVNATGVNATLLAQNVTAGNALLKENTTAPVSPTGISTNSAHVPHPANANATSSSNNTAGTNSSS